MAVENINWRGGLCMEVAPVPNNVVIFGASGDLAARKLLPALFSLEQRKLLHDESHIIGCARTPLTDEVFRENARRAILERFTKANPAELEKFLGKLSYIPGDYASPTLYELLSQKLAEMEKDSALLPGRVYYLSVPSSLYGTVVHLLGEAGLAKENYDGHPWRNVVIEKPFGHDLESSQKLNRHLRAVLKERQLYRIDHYLGKETVQNILMLRFANIIFEPIWNNRYIEHVQISAAETLGVEHRAGYYDQAGLLRDMFQNHMLEMLSLMAMEPPQSFKADRVRDEKAKLLRSIRPFPKEKLEKFIVRAQYGAGRVGGKELPAYRHEEGVAHDSRTETFTAAKLFIDNWRWHGVPFYLRSGKRLARRMSEIAVTFKRVPHSLFEPIRAVDLAPNTLVMNVQPEEGFSLSIQGKQPGPKLCMGSLTMNFRYADIFKDEIPEAYERLLLDCMLGDQTLFIRNDTIELAWGLLEPVLDCWSQEQSPCPLHTYAAGSWGPEASEELLARDGYLWRNSI
ncbi:MAG: glucose-6-phosphate dehydrogenase [Lentisphaerae bacterium GWF2_52_8]|nr:MAG: glucose-6-phosphate dehydrogenase [Lentisphaerae bacterium GWF2_52_8]